MSELEDLKIEISNLSEEFKDHKGELSSVLSTLVSSNEKISSGFEKLTEVFVKQEAQEKDLEQVKSTQREQTKLLHELDTKARLAVQSEINIKETAAAIKSDGIARNKEVKKILGAAAIILGTLLSGIALAMITLLLKSPPT